MPNKTNCDLCGKSIVKGNLNRHLKEVHGDGQEKETCRVCTYSSTRPADFRRHLADHYRSGRSDEMFRGPSGSTSNHTKAKMPPPTAKKRKSPETVTTATNPEKKKKPVKTKSPDLPVKNTPKVLLIPKPPKKPATVTKQEDTQTASIDNSSSDSSSDSSSGSSYTNSSTSSKSPSPKKQKSSTPRAPHKKSPDSSRCTPRSTPARHIQLSDLTPDTITTAPSSDHSTADENTQVASENQVDELGTIKNIQLQTINGKDLDLIASTLSDGIANREVTDLVSIYYPHTVAITPAQSPRNTSVPNTPGKPLPPGAVAEPEHHLFQDRITLDRHTMTDTFLTEPLTTVVKIEDGPSTSKKTVSATEHPKKGPKTHNIKVKMGDIEISWEKATGPIEVNQRRITREIKELMDYRKKINTTQPQEATPQPGISTDPEPTRERERHPAEDNAQLMGTPRYSALTGFGS